MLIFFSRSLNIGSSKHAQNSKVALKKLKNKSQRIEVKLELDHSAHRLDSNYTNATQIRVLMLKL